MSEIKKIDLHGMHAREAIEKLEYTIDRAIIADAWCIEIMHGRGTGKLKNEVSKYLKKSKQIKRFEVDPLNPGVTKAYL